MTEFKPHSHCHFQFVPFCSIPYGAKLLSTTILWIKFWFSYQFLLICVSLFCKMLFTFDDMILKLRNNKHTEKRNYFNIWNEKWYNFWCTLRTYFIWCILRYSFILWSFLEFISLIRWISESLLFVLTYLHNHSLVILCISRYSFLFSDAFPEYIYFNIWWIYGCAFSHMMYFHLFLYNSDTFPEPYILSYLRYFWMRSFLSDIFLK